MTKYYHLFSILQNTFIMETFHYTNMLNVFRVLPKHLLTKYGLYTQDIQLDGSTQSKR